MDLLMIDMNLETNNIFLLIVHMIRVFIDPNQGFTAMNVPLNNIFQETGEPCGDSEDVCRDAAALNE